MPNRPPHGAAASAPPPTPPSRRDPRRRVTLQDVATAAGVSKTAVSRALAGYPDIAPVTRERLTALAHQMGYEASAPARALASRKGSSSATLRCAVLTIGMDPAEAARGYRFGQIIAGIMARSGPERVDVHVVAGPRTLDPSSEEGRFAQETITRIIAADRADGFIVFPQSIVTPADVAPFEAAGVPFVMINRHFGQDSTHRVHCVSSDVASAMAHAVEHLQSLGHRHMAALLSDRPVSAVTDRVAGWREGLRRCGLSEADAPVIYFRDYPLPAATTDGAPEPAPRPDAAEATRQLLRKGLPTRGARPTAIVAYGDGPAHTVIETAETLGVRTPDQLTVIGLGNTIAPYTHPALCTHDTHPERVGAAAMELLAAILRGQVAERRHVLVPTEFVCRGARGSCGPAPSPR